MSESDILEKIDARAAQADAKKQEQREKLKAIYPDIYQFITELEEVFGPVKGDVKRRRT